MSKNGTKWNREPVKFYDKDGKHRLSIPGRTTIKDLVLAGMPVPRLVPEDAPWEENEIRSRHDGD